MIKELGFSALLFLGADCKAVSDRLLNAIEKVESGGNAAAVGDGGKAVGAYQIWPIRVQEVNRVSGRHYRLIDRLDRAKSRQMCQIYLDWADRQNTVKGHKLTEIELARCWNGGNWSSWKNKNTENYKNKIKKVYK